MNILDKLNSGELHAKARAARPDCVDTKGGIHSTPERAQFISWFFRMAETYGDDVKSWPAIPRAEYAERHVAR